MGKNQKIVIKMVNSKYENDKAVDNLLRYILTDKRTKDKCSYCGGFGVDYLDWERASSEFNIVQKFYGKNHGKRVYHMVISFPENFDDLYSICLIGNRIISDILKGFQCVFAIHQNTDNLHIHIGWNSVNYITGKKWHVSKEEWRIIKNKITKIAGEYHL